MPAMIRNGEIVEDRWLAVNTEASSPAPQQILTLDQWQATAEKSGTAVQLEPGQPPTPLFDHLDSISLVAINFPLFTDGRGFSYARELCERGFKGELRAVGYFIRDQLHYLRRCGFTAFALTEETDLSAALGSLGDFTEHSQASADQCLPLFRRR